MADLKQQNRLKDGTNKPKLKVKMQSASDEYDDVRKRLLEQTRFELAAKGVFRLVGMSSTKCCVSSDMRSVPDLLIIIIHDCTRSVSRYSDFVVAVICHLPESRSCKTKTLQYLIIIVRLIYKLYFVIKTAQPNTQNSKITITIFQKIQNENSKNIENENSKIIENETKLQRLCHP